MNKSTDLLDDMSNLIPLTDSMLERLRVHFGAVGCGMLEGSRTGVYLAFENSEGILTIGEALSIAKGLSA